MGKSVFRKLPIEIVIQILEHAVSTSHQAALSISILSKWCHELALPHVFKVLIVRPGFRPSPNRRGATRGPPVPAVFPHERGPLVHGIWAEKTAMTERSIRSIFDFCRSAHSLALSWERLRDLHTSHYLYNQPVLNISVERDHQHPPALHYPRPHLASPCRSLTLLSPWIMHIWRDAAFSSRIGCSVFLSITHLRLIEFEPRRLPLPRMPNLAFLAVPPPKDFSAKPAAPGTHSYLGAASILDSKEWPYLCMIVLTIDADAENTPLADLQRSAASENSRLYVVHAPCRLSAIRVEWEREVRGGESIWDRALRERKEWAGESEHGDNDLKADQSASVSPIMKTIENRATGSITM